MRVRPLTLVALALLAAPAAAQDSCPASTTPVIDPAIPTFASVNGYELGTKKATTAELYKYVDALAAAAPDRTIGGTLATTANGRPLKWLAIGAADEIARIDETAAQMQRLRHADETPEGIAQIAHDYPAIAWIAANVHGNEPSGADGALRLMYELLARTDCWNKQRLDRVVTFFQPTQNPDGREASTRTNTYSFDMNRDWFARSQPETDGKVALVHRYPPVLYIDAHEQGGTAGFFPPNADPIHHEISSAALHHINDVYGPAMRAAADAAGYDYTNYTSYDLFAMIYGDTVPSTAFGAAGMTFEKGSSSPYTEKTFEQYTNQRASLDALVKDKDQMVREWAAQFPEAGAQGAAGELEPNVVVQPTNTVKFPVPNRKVYGYVLRTDVHGADAAKLAERLMALDVEVYRTRNATPLAGYRGFSRRGGEHVEQLPAGAFVIPMAQPQKHWIQALLGEDPFVPYDYFYDVSGWSNIALMGLEAGVLTEPLPSMAALERVSGPVVLGSAPVQPAAGGYAFAGDSAGALTMTVKLLDAGVALRRVSQTGVTVAGRALPLGTIVAGAGAPLDTLRTLAERYEVEVSALPIAAPDASTVALRAPKVALLDGSGEDQGHTKFVLEKALGVRFTTITTSSTTPLTDYTTVIVTDAASVSPAALAQLQVFARTGGTVLAWGQQGTTIALASGMSTAVPQPNTGDVPGLSLAIDVTPTASPLAWGLSSRDFAYNTSDPILKTTGAENVVAKYASGTNAYLSGYATGTTDLEGTAVMIDSPVGAGHALLLSYQPAFRAWSESGWRVMLNAMLYPAASLPAVAKARADLRRTGVTGLRPGLLAQQFPKARDSVVRVGLTDVGLLEGLLASGRLPAGASIERDLTTATLRVPNAQGLEPHEMTWLPALYETLSRSALRPETIIL